MANIDQLGVYTDTLASFYMKEYPQYPLADHQQSIVYDIREEWSGAVLAFDEDKVVGFMSMNLERSNPNKRIFEVGFALMISRLSSQYDCIPTL